MNRPESSKYVPGLPSDDDIDTQTNSASPNSVKIYDGVADCAMNDADTIKNVKIRAKDLAQEKLLNKIADCVDGFLRDRLLTFPDDEIFSIANEIYHITDVKYNTFDSDDKMMIRATVLAQVDDNDIMNCLVRFFKERTDLKSQNEALRKENETLHAEIDDLKCQIEVLSNLAKNKRQIEVLSNLAKIKLDEGYRFFDKGNNTAAIKLYDEAIELNPNDVEAYIKRGDAYTNLPDSEKAIQDYDKAIELEPNNPVYYIKRTFPYWNLGKFEFCIQDCDKALELNPNDAGIYKHRGDCYKELGDETKAQADFKKAKELG